MTAVDMMSANVGEFKSHTRSLLTHTVLIDCGARAVCSRVVCSPLPSITMSVVLGVWCCWLGTYLVLGTVTSK